MLLCCSKREKAFLDKACVSTSSAFFHAALVEAVCEPFVIQPSNTARRSLARLLAELLHRHTEVRTLPGLH